MSLYPTRDWLTASGAESLANKVERYWRARGYEVGAYIEEMRVKDSRNAVYCVRSDLVAGVPPAKGKRP